MMREKIPVVLLNDTSVDRHHGCVRVMKSLKTLLDRNGLTVSAVHPAHRDWRNDKQFLDSMISSRLLLVNGEGTIHHDRPAGRLLLEAGAAARANGIPAALINAGWDGNSPEMAALLRSFALVALRDSDSATEVRNFGIGCRFVPDLSFYGCEVALEPRTRSGIGFTDNVDRLASIKLEACRRQAGGKMISILYGDPGIFGYFKFLRAGIALRHDVNAPLRIAQILRIRHLLWQACTTDSASFLDQLSRFRLLVSGRFHACTLAITVGTPFVAIPSNTRKIASLVQDVGLDSWRLGVPLEPSAIMSAAEHGWSHQERRRISDYLTNARQAVDNLFCDLRSLAQ